MQLEDPHYPKRWWEPCSILIYRLDLLKTPTASNVIKWGLLLSSRFFSFLFFSFLLFCLDCTLTVLNEVPMTLVIWNKLIWIVSLLVSWDWAIRSSVGCRSRSCTCYIRWIHRSSTGSLQIRGHFTCNRREACMLASAAGIYGNKHTRPSGISRTQANNWDK